MVHPDIEVRVGAHQIFSSLLNPSSSHQRNNIFCQPKKVHSSSSIAALLERLRTEKGGSELQRKGDELREIGITEKKWKQGQVVENSPNFNKISSILGKTADSAANLAEAVRTTLFILYPVS